MLRRSLNLAFSPRVLSAESGVSKLQAEERSYGAHRDEEESLSLGQDLPVDLGPLSLLVGLLNFEGKVSWVEGNHVASESGASQSTLSFDPGDLCAYDIGGGVGLSTDCEWR